MGPEIKELEERLAEFVGIEHAVACSSGTDALLLALMAYGIGAGDAILTSPFTFIATAEAISLLGATPVFVDIDPKTFNLDPKHLEKAITALQKSSTDYPLPAISPSSLRAKGIVTVDLFGLPGDYDSINAIAKKNSLFVIEDAIEKAFRGSSLFPASEEESLNLGANLDEKFEAMEASLCQMEG